MESDKDSLSSRLLLQITSCSRLQLTLRPKWLSCLGRTTFSRSKCDKESVSGSQCFSTNTLLNNFAFTFFFMQVAKDTAHNNTTMESNKDSLTSSSKSYHIITHSKQHDSWLSIPGRSAVNVTRCWPGLCLYTTILLFSYEVSVWDFLSLFSNPNVT